MARGSFLGCNGAISSALYKFASVLGWDVVFRWPFHLFSSSRGSLEYLLSGGHFQRNLRTCCVDELHAFVWFDAWWTDYSPMGCSIRSGGSVSKFFSACLTHNGFVVQCPAKQLSSVSGLVRAWTWAGCGATWLVICLPVTSATSGSRGITTAAHLCVCRWRSSDVTGC